MGLRIDIYDEVGIGGGASGVSGGLLHPYSPKGQALLFGPWIFQDFQFCLVSFFALCRVEIGNLKSLGTFLHNIILL
jgi:hypothetical protein